MSREKLGIVQEGLDRMGAYGRFVELRTNRSLQAESLKRTVAELVDERFRAEIEKMVADQVGKAVRDLQALQPKAGLPLRDIVSVVVDVTGITAPEILGPRRIPEVAAARQFTYWLTRRLRPDLSSAQIARAYSKDDDSSVRFGVRKIERLQEANPFRAWLAAPAVVALLDQGLDR